MTIKAVVVLVHFRIVIEMVIPIFNIARSVDVVGDLIIISFLPGEEGFQRFPAHVKCHRVASFGRRL